MVERDDEHSHAAVAIVTNATRTRLFVQQKDEHYPDYPLGYSLFGGAIEAGESPREALARELKEELGSVPVLTRARPEFVFTNRLPSGYTLSLFEIVVEDRELDSLGDRPVLEGKRGVVLDREQLRDTPFIWGLGEVIAEYLERRATPRTHRDIG